MNATVNYRNIARRWFKNNHPLVQYWEQHNIKWDLHHWDSSLRHNNPQRYSMWMVEDLIPMTHTHHAHIHSENNHNSMCGKQHSDSTKKKISEHCKGTHSGGNAYQAVAVMCVETGQVFDCISNAKKWLGVGDIGVALRHPSRTAGGYHWTYLK